MVRSFDDEASARAFFASEELHDAMDRAGVDGEPRLLWIGSIY